MCILLMPVFFNFICMNVGHELLTKSSDELLVSIHLPPRDKFWSIHHSDSTGAPLILASSST